MNTLGKVAVGLGAFTLAGSVALNVKLINQIRKINKLAGTYNLDIEEYVIGSKEDAAEVLGALMTVCEKYSSVTVADYYDMIGIESTYTDNNIGWTIDTLKEAKIITVRGGYVIKFPKAEVLAK